MSRNSFSRPASSKSDSPAEQNQTENITPELVRKVADEIYRMLQHESRIDYERRRNSHKSTQRFIGGR
jgi:hypothetical protein